MDNLPAPPDTIAGQIATGVVFGLSAVCFIIFAVSRYFQKRLTAHPDDIRRSDTIELIDSAHIRNDNVRIIDAIYGGEGRPEGVMSKLDRILDDTLHLKNEQEIARRARDEVARLLAQEKSHRE